MSGSSAHIFIIGRQHSGNTMLARCLGQSPDVYSVTGEGTFFEHQATLENRSTGEMAVRILSHAEGSGVKVPEGKREALRRNMEAVRGEPSGLDTAGRMYARCMNWITRERGAERWAQKATSYIFYVENILDCFPDARLLFLARNPLDLAASMKRRGVWRAVARMTYGWNKGVRLALRSAQAHPENLLVVRYEDFVRTPEQKMREICAFCDLEFSEEYLKIPHVNRSESPYNQSSPQKGISNSRLGYYRTTLTDVETGAVRTLVKDRLLDELYPEALAESQTPLSASSYAAALAAAGLLDVGRHHFQALLKDPHHVLQRVKKRLLA